MPRDRTPVDLRLVPAAAAMWVGTWAAAGLRPGVTLALAAGALLLAAGLLLAGVLRAPPTTRTTALAAVVALGCLAAGGLSVAARQLALTGGSLPALADAGASARVGLVVLGDPRPVATRPGNPDGRARELVVVTTRAERVEARGRVTQVRAPVVVLAEAAGWRDLLPGTRLDAAGRLMRSNDTTTAAVLLARGPPRAVAWPGPVHRAAGALRSGLRAAVDPLPEAQRGLVPGLVVGDTSRLPPALEEDFRTVGLTHLVAVSGANVAIVCGAVLVCALRLGLRRRVAAVAAGLALVGFVVLARPQPSVLRAAVMGLVALLALASGRRRAALPALAAAVLVLLAVDPGLARSYGFALSVLATAGIVVLAPRWTAVLAARGLPAPVAAALAVPAAAQMACGPVVAMLAGSVSLVAVPANLLVAPAVAPATLLGVGAAVVTPLSDGAARALGRLAGWPATWIVAVAERAASIPHAAVGWPDGVAGGALLAAGTVAAWAVGRLLCRRRRWAAGVMALVVGVAAGLVAAPARWPPRGWVLVMCDVGQGDALVLAAGQGAAVVVDAGPDARAVDGCLRRLGVRRVALALLTHLHSDHVDGLPGVLGGRQVDVVEVGPLDEPADGAERVAGAVADKRVPVRRVVTGEQSQIGPLRWRVLWPARVLRDGSVPNNASIVILVEVAGLRLLLTGDVEEAAQRALRRALAGITVDVLKVAHHGSPSQDPGLLAGLRPRVALVSVGADNRYGHPAPATLGLLGAVGAAVWRTDRDGDVAVVGDGGRLRVARRGR